MNASRILVIATRNRGKLYEIKELLADFPVELKSLDDFGEIPDIEEDGETFDDNAYKKSSGTAKILGYPALADDSGLLIEELNGEPGVYSSRYAGENATDSQRCALILEKMKGKTDRKAAFECVISVAVPQGPALTYDGRCDGLVTESVPFSAWGSASSSVDKLSCEVSSFVFTAFAASLADSSRPS